MGSNYRVAVLTAEEMQDALKKLKIKREEERLGNLERKAKKRQAAGKEKKVKVSKPVPIPVPNAPYLKAGGSKEKGNV
jgi:hypothetical protein